MSARDYEDASRRARGAFLAAIVLTGSLKAWSWLPPSAGDESPSTAAVSLVPYFDDRDFTPLWTAPPRPRPERFDLLSQTGARFTEADVRGRVHVVSFFFTRCTICPTLIARLKRVQAEAPPGVLLVSYSATPDLDRPADLAAFGATEGIDRTRWRLVTGDAAQIVRLAREVYFADDPRLRDGDFLHTEKVVLVDGEGYLRGVYNGTQPFEITKLLEDIAQIAGT